MYTLLGAGEIRTPTVQGKYGMGGCQVCSSRAAQCSMKRETLNRLEQQYYDDTEQTTWQNTQQ